MKAGLNNDLISIIIPIFNCRKTVSKCLKSILAQTYHNIEVIVVDDGSKDGSAEICDYIGNTDSRISVIHKKNQGVSSARNTGLTHSKGQFICFVDSDDWMPPQAIKQLYDQIISCEADICIGKVLSIESGRNYILREFETKVYDLNCANELFMFTEYVDWAPWAKLYKRRIIEKYHCIFQKTIKSCEDSIFIADYLLKCHKATCVNSIVYYYNNLNAVTASRRYYKNYKEWSLFFAQKYAALFKRFETDYSRSIVNRKYILRCFETCSYYCNQGIDDNTKCEDILESLNLFYDYCKFEYDWPVNSIVETNKKECIKRAYACTGNEQVDVIRKMTANREKRIKKVLKLGFKLYKSIKYYGIINIL